MNKKTKTKVEWLKLISKEQLEFYDYSLIPENSLMTSEEKFKIICPVHGIFEQTAGNHLQGKGCRKCSIENRTIQKRITTEKYLERVRKEYPNNYDYSKVSLTAPDFIKGKIEIICPEHGSFFQKAENHLYRKDRCPKCSGKNYNTKDYLKSLPSKHLKFYDYSKTIFNGMGNKITIICPIHGKFEQLASSHKSGKGCSLCSGGVLDTKESFIIKAKNKLTINYDYSRVVYINSHTKIEIGCPDQHWFWQNPHNHLQGYGCNICTYSVSKEELNLREFLKRFNFKSVEYNYRPKWLITNKHPLELDIFIKDLNLAIEYNGAYYHSTLFKEDTYHEEKYNLCKQNGINLIYIFDFERKVKVRNRLINYINNPNKYEISFKNNKRKYRDLACYGQSYIKLKINKVN